MTEPEGPPVTTLAYCFNRAMYALTNAQEEYPEPQLGAGEQTARFRVEMAGVWATLALAAAVLEIGTALRDQATSE